MSPRPPASPGADDDAAPDLAWDAGDEGEGPLAGLSPAAAARRRQAPSKAPSKAPPDDDRRPASRHRWSGALGAALAAATAALAHLDARWADLSAPLQAGLLARVAWAKARAASAGAATRWRCGSGTRGSAPPPRWVAAAAAAWPGRRGSGTPTRSGSPVAWRAARPRATLGGMADLEPAAAGRCKRRRRTPRGRARRDPPRRVIAVVIRNCILRIAWNAETTGAIVKAGTISTSAASEPPDREGEHRRTHHHPGEKAAASTSPAARKRCREM
jgi:hypothetical protein